MACTLDFWCLDEGLGGSKNKRKRRDEEEEQEVAAASMDVVVEEGEQQQQHRSSKRLAVLSLEDPNKPSPLLDHPTFDGVPRAHRPSASQVTRPRTTLQQRAWEREVRRAFRARNDELKEEIRRHKVEKRERGEDRERRKKENVLRSCTKLQVISNPKTLEKITKSKQNKLLKVVPDVLLNENKGKNKKNTTT